MRGNNGADAITRVGAADVAQCRAAAGNDAAGGAGMGVVVGQADTAGGEGHGVAADRAAGAAAYAAGAGREQSVVGFGGGGDSRRCRQALGCYRSRHVFAACIQYIVRRCPGAGDTAERQA